ncbi:MAG: HAD family hydrolase [Burkholderiales bacterium]|nr:HAD family hydrolase [Burkholderiales bacterium]
MKTAKPRLTLFDLDHTLLHGDSDVLWCAFLMDRGVLDRAVFEPRNAAMDAAYRAGTVGTREFSEFYVGTLAGRSANDWSPLRADFLRQEIMPRIPAAALALVRRHAEAGDRVVLTTATNRFLTELTAKHLGIGELIATDCEVDAQGRFTGRTAGTLNMRDGKVDRLHAWLGERGLALNEIDSTAYSDSINDLPLLCAVDRAVAVDPDARLAAEAAARGWPVLRLNG